MNADGVSIFAAFRAAALRQPGQTRISSADRSLTAAALLERAETVGRFLARTGAPVAVCDSPDPIDFAPVLLGCLRERVPMVIAPPEPQSWRQALADFPGLLLLSGTSAGTAAGAWEPQPPQRVRLDDVLRGDAAVPVPDRRGHRLTAGAACVVYTSGTTGAPVGVVTTGTSYVVNAEDMAALLPGPEEEPLVALASPVYHSYGLDVGVMLPLLRGLPLRWLPFHHPRPFLRHLRQCGRGAVLVAGPAIYRALLQYPEELSADGAPAFRLGLSSGDLLPPDLRTRFARDFGIRVVDCYGTTETHGIAAGLDPESSELTPFPSVRLRLASEEGGTEGELLIGGPKVMQGYVGGAPEAQTRLEDRWHNTQDWVHLLPGGRLRLAGRISSMIRVAGRRVQAEAVESSLEALDGVAEALAFPVPDREHGEIVAALVKRDPRFSLDADEIPRRLGTVLPPYMLPRRITVVDEIPKQNGKKRRFHRPIAG